MRNELYYNDEPQFNKIQKILKSNTGYAFICKEYCTLEYTNMYSSYKIVDNKKIVVVEYKNLIYNKSYCSVIVDDFEYVICKISLK